MRGVLLVLATSAVVCGCQGRPAATSTSEAPLPSARTIVNSPAIAPSSSASAAAPTSSALAAPPPPPAPVRPPTVEWVRRWGAYGDDYGKDVVVASDGTIILAGDYQFQITLDKTTLAGESLIQSAPGSFIAGLSPDGKLKWATSLHAKQNDNISGLALGPEDSVMFTGTIRDMNAGCGRIRAAGADDILVGALGPNGRCLFTDAYGTKNNDWGQAITTDRVGNLYVTGTAQPGTNFGGGKINTTDKASAFAASFTKAGDHRWSLDISGKAQTSLQTVTADAEGNVYIAISFQDTADWGDGPRTSHGEADVGLVALSSDGKLRLSTSFGGPKSDYAGGIVTDPRSGDIIVVGSFDELIDIGRDHLVSAGGTDWYVARLDKTGKPKWARRLGGPEHDGPKGVALDAAGNLYITGYSRTPFEYGGFALKNAGKDDIIVVSMTPDGSPRWALSFGGPEYDAAHGLAVEPSGRVLITGTFHAEADFAGTTLKSDNGSGDIFLVALQP